MKYTDKPSNYDSYPFVRVPGEQEVQAGWACILDEIETRLGRLDRRKKRLVVECYQGVLDEEVEDTFKRHFDKARFYNSSLAMLEGEEISNKLKEDITADEVFGYMTRYAMDCYFSGPKAEKIREAIDASAEALTIVYGTGAAWLCPEFDLLVYADMPRWEIQRRFRRNLVGNVGVDNKGERASLQYKRAFFVDWRICDRFKKQLMKRWDYILDTTSRGEPKMISADVLSKGLQAAVRRPFRLVPFFDPGPWGGQWMREVCNLDREAVNFAWCFDCVPEENSLLLGIGHERFETPSINLVFAHPKELLGEPVHGRFGDEFPIRFDMLDTMEGGNLSLQVHPLTEYIQETFGMHYTQDESYYLLDAQEDAVVYLGLKETVDPAAMIRELEEAQRSGAFDAHKHVGSYPVKKHDHVLIPAGTVHCSGKNAMVLEISATPFIFTFKLWDWGRLGLDGRPRPVHIAHGKRVIQWDRTESWVRKEALNRVETIGQGDGWTEEHTGLHEREFIETRRHWFTKPVLHQTNRCVNVLNVVEGREVIVESPAHAFEPFVVHYAETFIVPAHVDEYTIRPYGESEGQVCGTIKAYVKTHA